MTTTRPVESLPSSALILGLAGLVPFAAAAIAVWASAFASLAMTAGVAYGAVILSFLGGIRWGTTIGPYSPTRARRDFTLSVLPALAGWSALLMPFLPALCLLIAGFLLQALWDVLSVENGYLPGWFGKLRMFLTTGAIAALLVIVARLIL